MVYNHKDENSDKQYNIDKFQKDGEHNILYITGLSGSGKTTLAYSYKNRDSKIEIIHLDKYYEMKDISNTDPFDQYIKSNFKEYNKFKELVKDNMSEVFFNKNNPNHDKYYKIMDEFLLYINKYSKSIYPNKSIIVEGIQLYDAVPSFNMFKDKPMIIKGNGILKSFNRMSKRDGIFKNKNVSTCINAGISVIDQYKKSESQLNKLRLYMDNQNK